MIRYLILLGGLSVMPLAAKNSPREVEGIELPGVSLPAESFYVLAETGKAPANVVCKDGVCRLVPIATRAPDCKCGNCQCAAVARQSRAEADCEEHRFHGPIANTTRAAAHVTKRVAGAVAYRVTHPFNGRFRR